MKWGLEGAGILLGDVAAKGGSVSDATWWYTIAAGIGRGAGYPFQAIAEERVAHADERVALYQDADPRNDPPFLGEEASVCHLLPLRSRRQRATLIGGRTVTLE